MWTLLFILLVLKWVGLPFRLSTGTQSFEVPSPTYDPSLLPCSLEVNHKISQMLQEVVVASFTEIKTGYRGFETNEIRYFVYLLCAFKILFAGVHEW